MDPNDPEEDPVDPDEPDPNSTGVAATALIRASAVSSSLQPEPKTFLFLEAMPLPRGGYLRQDISQYT